MCLTLCGKADRNDDEKDEKPPYPVRVNAKSNERLAVKAGVKIHTSSVQATSSKPKKNLWELAGQKLDEKDRKLLDIGNAPRVTESIENVIEDTKQKYEEYKNGGLKIRKRNGGQIDVRRSVESIIRYALQAKDIITEIVSFDPTGHAATAWTIVSFGLTMVDNEIERRDDIFEASEYLSRILAYYTIVEKNLRDLNVESDKGLEDALVEVYTAILQYTAEVKQTHNESTADRIRKSITALVQQPLKDLKSAVETKAATLEKWKQLTVVLDQKQQAENMLNRIDEMVRRQEIIESNQRSLQDERILNWPSNAAYSTPQINKQADRMSNTGDWFILLPKYEEWKTTSGQILWLHGAVGCGKSTLCSTIIQDIHDFCHSDSSKIFAYWYFDFNSGETQKVSNMIRCLLRQFMPRTLPASLIKTWEEHSHRGSEPPQERFVDILNDVLENFEGDLFLIFDALDECPEKSRHNERGLLLGFMDDLIKKHHTKLHILATSRPEPDIREKLEDCWNVNLETGLAEDVETFVRDKVDGERLKKWGQSIQSQILKQFLDTSERRFRWADLQLKRLEESKTKDAIQKALTTIPATLEDTYKDILERLPPDDRKAAREILMWLCFSAEPLSLRTVADVVSFRFPDDVITTCTTSLITPSTADDTVRLAHFSVKEFLIRQDIKGCDWYQFSAISGHEAIVRKSINLLLETTEILTKAAALQRPLLRYAARNWDQHLMELNESNIEYTDLQDKVDRLFTQNDIYLNWTRLFYGGPDYWWEIEECAPRPPPLVIASGMGLTRTVEALLTKDAEHFALDGDEPKSALNAAAEQGHLDILKLLLERVDKIPRKVSVSILKHITCDEDAKAKMGIILDTLWDKGALHDQSIASSKVIDVRMTEAAAQNTELGLTLVGLLLDRKHRMGVKITADLLRAVTRNRVSSVKIMELLFNRCDGDICITSSFMHSLPYIYHGSDMMDLILSRRRNEINNVVEIFAVAKRETLELIIQARFEDIQVTEKLMVAAASNTEDAGTMRLLLNKKKPGVSISKDVLKAAVDNYGKGGEILDILLDECGQNAPVDDEIMELIVSKRYGLDMIRTLLQRQQAGFVVTEKILDAAAKHNTREMFELLVNNAGQSDLPISENTVYSAAKNYSHGRELMEYLFDLRKPVLHVTEELLISIAQLRTATDRVLPFLLTRCPDMQATDRLFEAASRDADLMKFLLDRPHDNLPIEPMMKIIGTGHGPGGEVFALLLERQLVEIDEWLVESVAGNYSALREIRDRQPDFPVTPKAALAAGRDVHSLRLLLTMHNDQIPITEETIKSAFRGYYSTQVIELLLTRFVPAALPITEDILIDAVRMGRIEALALMIEKRTDLNLQVVWKAIWQDPDIDPFWLARAPNAFFPYSTFVISELMLDKISCVNRPHAQYVFGNFISSCIQHKVTIPTTERSIALIVEHSNMDVIEKFLGNYTNLEVTGKHIEAARRNCTRYVDNEGLVSLLLSKGSSMSKSRSADEAYLYMLYQPAKH